MCAHNSPKVCKNIFNKNFEIYNSVPKFIMIGDGINLYMVKIENLIKNLYQNMKKLIIVY